MLAQDKSVVVYGAAGHIGSAVARAFAREGAQVFLTGSGSRSPSWPKAVAPRRRRWTRWTARRSTATWTT